MSAAFQPPLGHAREELLLAPYAMRSSESRGRVHDEPGIYTFRLIFQRDRERIVHCRAFRRMTSKTQVLVAQTNDHHRTRLTHSLEVAQVSRTMARILGLNEDLVEAVALSHDIGHPPFGHAGERALNECLKDDGGFDHNLHALHIVDQLENPYPAFSGLNLSWEVRAAFAYHSKKRDDAFSKELTAEGEPLLEFQVVDYCDSLAYDTHDLDDALGAGIISIDDLRPMEFWRIGAERAEQRWPNMEMEQYRPTVVRALFEWQILDLAEQTKKRLSECTIQSVADVRRIPDLVGFSADVLRVKTELQSFLRSNVYRHHWVSEMAQEGARTIHGLFEHFLANPDHLPPHHAARLKTTPKPRAVGDYIAGMTDRFAMKDFRRLCQKSESV